MNCCAAKFEEHEEHMVCMEQLQVVAHQCEENPDHYTKQEFLKMELYLLKFFDWSVSHPTAVHFAEYFLSVEDVEMEEDDSTPTSTSSQSDRGEVRAQVDRLTSCFLEASLRGIILLLHGDTSLGVYIMVHVHVLPGHGACGLPCKFV